MAYQQVTLAQLRVQLARRVEQKPWWTFEDARHALNEGLRIWGAATGRWVTKTYRPIVPNDPWVPLVGAIAQPTRVLYNTIPLEKCSQADLDYGFPAWRGATTDTAGHPDRPGYWAPVSLNLIVIYPAAAMSLFPTTLEIAGVFQTPLLVAEGDFIDLGEEEHDVLLGYALHVLSFKIGGQRFVNTYPLWIAFLKAAAAENRQFAASAFYRRLLGLDQQRWLRKQERAVENPVDQVIAQISKGRG